MRFPHTVEGLSDFRYAATRAHGPFSALASAFSTRFALSDLHGLNTINVRNLPAITQRQADKSQAGG